MRGRLNFAIWNADFGTGCLCATKITRFFCVLWPTRTPSQNRHFRWQNLNDHAFLAVTENLLYAFGQKVHVPNTLYTFGHKNHCICCIRIDGVSITTLPIPLRNCTLWTSSLSCIVHHRQYQWDFVYFTTIPVLYVTMCHKYRTCIYLLKKPYAINEPFVMPEILICNCCEVRKIS